MTNVFENNRTSKHYSELPILKMREEKRTRHMMTGPLWVGKRFRSSAGASNTLLWSIILLWQWSHFPSTL